MRSPDEIAAEIEGLCAVPIWTSDEYLAGRKLLPEAARALRARPGREEAEWILDALWSKARAAAFATDAKARREGGIAAAMRGLGYGPEGEG